MAIGILSALDGIQGEARPDDNSVVPPIDRLASLPQALIMQMAQKGQIPKTMVAPVLAKKAENAQMGMQMQAAMQRAQAGAVPPSTVIEKVIAQNAAQEAAPMNRSNVGVASAPMRPDMYRRGMAGGGIVAFQTGGYNPYTSEESYTSFQDYVNKKKAAGSLPADFDASAAINVEPVRNEVGRIVDYNFFGDGAMNLNIRGVGDQNPDVEGTTVLPKSGGSGVRNILTEGSNGGDGVYGKGTGGLGGILTRKKQEKLDALRKMYEQPVPEVEKTDVENLSKEQLDALSIETFGKPLGEVQDVKKDDGVITVSAEDYRKRQAEKKAAEEAATLPTIEEDAGLDNISAAEGKIQTEAIVKKLKEDQKGNKNKPAEPKEFVGLSGDDVAMLGLQFGLELLGTDQQNFFTAIGKAGKPALKTALALQQEKKKQAFTKSEREAGQKFQLELQDKKQAGDKEIQELANNAPTKIQKIARDLAKMKRKNGIPNFTDLFNASKIVGANATTESAIIAVAGKGVESGLSAYEKLIQPGGALRNIQLLAVGRTAKVSEGERQIVLNAKAQLAQQRGVSADSVSDQDAAQYVLDQQRKKMASKGMAAAGVAEDTFGRIVEERFPKGNRVQFSDL